MGSGKSWALLAVLGLLTALGVTDPVDAAKKKATKCREGMTLNAGQSCVVGSRGPTMHVLSEGIEFRAGEDACVRFRRDGKIRKFELKVVASAIHNSRGRLEVSDLACGRLKPVTVKTSWMWDSLVIAEARKGARMESRFRSHRRQRIEQDPALKEAAPGS